MAKKAGRRSNGLGKARALGRALAVQTLDHRKIQLRKRRAVKPARARALAAGRPAIPAETMRALAVPPPTGLLVAEGDSWFDYPLHDVLTMLEDEHGFDVESAAHKGDTVEDMAYSCGQFDDFTRLLERLLRQGRVPDAILLSGGGNDIAGNEFAMLLNHAASGLPPINDDVVRGVIDVRTRNAYVFLISGLKEIATQMLKRPIPVVVHGYDYPVPDGRGFLGGFGFLPGPWLQPGFHRKGFADLGANTAVMGKLIDSFNAMLRQLTRTAGFEHVRYVDLRDTLSHSSGYKRDWANELHPTKSGFSAVANKIASAI
jgi:lysophospholipase L1-like esterase